MAVQQKPRPISAPVIAEVAQPYQNDPRTQLARQMLATGASTAPTAGGGWAFADGIARVLQGGIGGYVDKQQQSKYKAAESDIVDAAKAMAAQKIAAASGAPAPPTPQQSQPLVPQTAPAPQAVASPPQGGGALPPPFAPGALPQGAGGVPSAVQAVDIPASSAAGMAGLPPGAGGPPRPPASPFASQGAQPAWLDPLAGRGHLTSAFGARRAPMPGASTNHNGLDFAAEAGSPVGAASDGVVVRAWNDTKNGGGNSVIIQHADGSRTGYAHLGSFNVKRGDTVVGGQPIGVVGSTGRATGNHLHFTYRTPDGKRADPSQLNFGSPAAGPASQQPQTAGVPSEAEVPVPAAAPMPETPQAEPATKSGLLQQAYELLAGGSPFTYDRAQKLLKEGLTEQGQMDEKAAGRRQQLTDLGFQAALDRFGTDRRDDRLNAMQTNTDIRKRKYQVQDREDEQDFKAGEAKADRDLRLRIAQMDNDAAWKRQVAQIDAARVTAKDKTEAKRSAFMQTAHGLKFFNETSGAAQAASNLMQQLDDFAKLAKGQRSGGVIGRAFPALGITANTRWQELNALSNRMAQTLAKNLKGNLSDKDVTFLKESVPSIMSTGRANETIIRQMRDAAQRAADFERERWNAAAEGNMGFVNEWTQFQRDVPYGSGITFEQWRDAPSLGGHR